jgi:LiaI-LiaF-like transmembrane region
MNTAAGRERRPERAGLMGPIVLIALGVMFLAGQFWPAWGVSRTWPTLLIVIGVVKLLESVRSRGPRPQN